MTTRYGDTGRFYEERYLEKKPKTAEKPAADKTTKFAQDLKAMGITAEIIEKAGKDGIINKDELAILELIAKNFSVNDIVNQLSLRDSKYVYTAFGRSTTLIRKAFSDIARELPKPAKPEVITQALKDRCKMVFKKYLSKNKKLPSPQLLSSKLQQNLIYSKVTPEEIRQAYKQDQDSAHHYAPLLLTLYNLEPNEITQILGLPEAGLIRDLAGLGLVKILKQREKNQPAQK